MRLGPARRGRRSRRRARRHSLLFLFAIALGVTPFALTGANLVADSTADQYDTSAGLNQIKPQDCSSIILSGLYKGTGDVVGDSTNDLVLGGSAAQSLSGGAGDDCILGGAGGDTLQGGPGASDVCIGGLGEDTFVDCETIVEGDATF